VGGEVQSASRHPGSWPLVVMSNRDHGAGGWPRENVAVTRGTVAGTSAWRARGPRVWRGSLEGPQAPCSRGLEAPDAAGGLAPDPLTNYHYNVA
jgi:hypothetical protein